MRESGGEEGRGWADGNTLVREGIGRVRAMQENDDVVIVVLVMG